MARKRQLKKQRKKDLLEKGIDNPELLKDLLQDKKKYNKLQEVYNTYEVKDPEKIARDPYKAEKKLKQRAYDQERIKVRTERNEFLKSIGIKDAAERKAIYQSNQKWDTFLTKYKKEEAIKNRPHMVIFWRDKTQEKAHGHNVAEQKNALRYLSQADIIRHIKEVMSKDYLWSQHGEIEIMITNDPQSLIQLYTGRSIQAGTQTEKKVKEQEWELVYSGRVERKRPLLIAMGGIIQLLYKGSKREAIGDIIFNVTQLNEKLGKELARELGFASYATGQKSIFSESDF